MFKIEIVSLKSNQKWGSTFSTLDMLNSWKDFHVESNTWGLPEREIRKKILNTETSEFVYPGGMYDDADVVKEEIRDVIVPGDPPTTESVTFVTIKAEYSIKISDLLNEAKLTKLEELSTSTDTFLKTYRGIIKVDNVLWDSGDQYLTNIDKTLKEADKVNPIISFPVTWYNYNKPGEDAIGYQLSRSILEDLRSHIETDMYIKGQQAYLKKWQLKNEINTATSYEDIQNISIDLSELLEAITVF